MQGLQVSRPICICITITLPIQQCIPSLRGCHQARVELQEDLIGQEKERAGDESRRAKVHQQWLEQQDEQQVAQLMAGLRNGFRRKRAGDLLDEDVST